MLKKSLKFLKSLQGILVRVQEMEKKLSQTDSLDGKKYAIISKKQAYWPRFKARKNIYNKRLTTENLKSIQIERAKKRQILL